MSVPAPAHAAAPADDGPTETAGARAPAWDVSLAGFAPWLANGLRGKMSRAQDTCRLKRIAQTVQLVECADAAGATRLVIEGVHTCKSPMCPLCVRKWQRVRCTDIKLALDHWGEPRCLFWTGTTAHNRSQSTALTRRVLRRAYGDMWSGRKGQAFARLLGGKPESIRAIESTWSYEHHFHQHIHSILFLQGNPELLGLSLDELEDLFFERWCEALETTLKSFNRFVSRVLSGKACSYRVESELVEGRNGEVRTRRRRVVACPECASGADCSHYRERATRLFGKKLIHKRETLRVSLQRIADQLQAFTLDRVLPVREYGVKLKRVREGEGLDTYLSKLGAMGFELAHATTKRGVDELGHVGGDNIRHFNQWEMMTLACLDDYRSDAAGLATTELFWATRGTQPIVFSDREALGLGPDLVDEDETEPEVLIATGDTTRLIGHILPIDWRANVRSKRHLFIAQLHRAHAEGKLSELDIVHEGSWWSSTPATEDPQKNTGPPPLRWWNRLGAESAGEARGRRYWQRREARIRLRDEERLREQRERDAGVALLTRFRRQANLRDALIEANASSKRKATSS